MMRELLGLGGLAVLCAGVWLVSGAGAALVVAGTAFFVPYAIGEVRALLRRRD